MDSFLAWGRVIGKIVTEERPLRILEISGEGSRYGRLLKAVQVFCEIPDGTVDRIVLTGSTVRSGDSPYNRVIGADIMDNPHTIDEYDMIVILNLFEQIDANEARLLLDVLQYKVTRQILILTPLDTGEGYRKYHPLVFLGLDFCYSLHGSAPDTMQVYSVFPKISYEAIPIDHIPATDAAEKLNIAFVLPHQGLTGGMKALLQQIRHLTRRGHTVKVYFRSARCQNAIPAWSDLTGEDYTQQIVIPASGRYLEYIQDADIILLGWMGQIPEFLPSKIPVALWEQGSQMMYGEFGKALNSTSRERLVLHRLFRLPIHLLAVSNTNVAALKGIYNREAFLYYSGVDTEFYHPEKKRNDIPVVMLVGNPSAKFKGFDFAFDVLRRAYAEGLRFRVKWASQVPVRYGEIDFPLEVIVNPPQAELAELYRSADILLSTSLYESYCLPPLEAMASGAAVIAADCVGIRSYAVTDENCILCRQGDISAMVNAMGRLLGDQGERDRLALAGQETALEHSADKTVKLLENRLSSIVRYDRRLGDGGGADNRQP